MARRGPVDVEVVDDDEVGDHGAAPTDDTPGAAAGHRRGRTPLIVGAVVVGVLAAAGVVGQMVQDRRERATIAAVAGLTGAVDLLAGPPAPVWVATAESGAGLDGVRTPDDLLVGVEHTVRGPVVVRALEVETGDEAWRTELVDGTTRAAVPSGAQTWPYSGSCLAVGDGVDRVACWVDDSVQVARVGVPETLPPSVVRVVTLDARRGSVVADLTDALPAGARPTSYTVVGDVVVLVVPAEDEVELVAVTPGGGVAWRTTVPAAPMEHDPDAPRVLLAPAAGGLLSVRTADALRLLDTQGRSVRTVELGGRHAYVDPASGYVIIVDAGPTGLHDEPAATPGTTVLRPGGDVEVDGHALRVLDDGSVPGTLLTHVAGRVVAWGEDGAELWSHQATDTWDVLLLDGRVHLDVGSSVVALDARTGAELWKSDATADVPVTDGRHLLALAAATRTGERAEMVALDPATGDEMWRAPVPDGTDQLAATNGLLVAVGQPAGESRPRITVLR